MHDGTRLLNLCADALLESTDAATFITFLPKILCEVLVQRCCLLPEHGSILCNLLKVWPFKQFSAKSLGIRLTKQDVEMMLDLIDSEELGIIKQFVLDEECHSLSEENMDLLLDLILNTDLSKNSSPGIKVLINGYVDDQNYYSVVPALQNSNAHVSKPLEFHFWALSVDASVYKTRDILCIIDAQYMTTLDLTYACPDDFPVFCDEVESVKITFKHVSELLHLQTISLPYIPDLRLGRHISDSISKLKKLEYLKASSGLTPAEVLTDILERGIMSPQMKSLELIGCQLSVHALECVAKNEFLHNLRELNLSETELNGPGMQHALSKVLMKNAATLKCLFMEDCGLHIKILKELCTMTLSKMSRLEKLYIISENVDSNDVICHIKPLLRKLEYLNLDELYADSIN